MIHTFTVNIPPNAKVVSQGAANAANVRMVCLAVAEQYKASVFQLEKMREQSDVKTTDAS
jgi:hypothetical protein